MYNYNHLYYFYITVKSKGVTSAAKHLSISQPSLSCQLKVLENFLQIKLFRKIGRKNELTSQGALIYGFCRQMFEISEEMDESITDKVPHGLRRIFIGISSEVANSFVVEVISHFLSGYDQKLRPKVVMISGSHERLAEQLRFRELDVVVTSISMKDPELNNLQKVEMPVNLVCTLDKNLPIKDMKLEISAVLEHISSYGNDITQWVMPSRGFKLRSEIDNFFEQNDIKGRIVFESDVVESLTRSVVDDIGIAFLPLIYVPKELENKSIYSFGPTQGYWKHRIFLASHIKNKDDQLIKSLSVSFDQVCIHPIE